MWVIGGLLETIYENQSGGGGRDRRNIQGRKGFRRVLGCWVVWVWLFGFGLVRFGCDCGVDWILDREEVRGWRKGGAASVRGKMATAGKERRKTQKQKQGRKNKTEAGKQNS